MNFHCFKNFNSFLPYIPKIYFNKKSFRWNTSMNNTLKYFFEKTEKKCNKIIGISNSIFPKKNSINFVWGYNHENDLFDIGLLIRKNNSHNLTKMCSVYSGEEINLKLNVLSKDNVEVEVNHNKLVVDFQFNSVVFLCNPCFGDRKGCPHHMSLEINNP